MSIQVGIVGVISSGNSDSNIYLPPAITLNDSRPNMTSATLEVFTGTTQMNAGTTASPNNGWEWCTSNTVFSLYSVRLRRVSGADISGGTGNFNTWYNLANSGIPHLYWTWTASGASNTVSTCILEIRNNITENIVASSTVTVNLLSTSAQYNLISGYLEAIDKFNPAWYGYHRGPAIPGIGAPISIGSLLPNAIYKGHEIISISWTAAWDGTRLGARISIRGNHPQNFFTQMAVSGSYTWLSSEVHEISYDENLDYTMWYFLNGALGKYGQNPFFANGAPVNRTLVFS